MTETQNAVAMQAFARAYHAATVLIASNPELIGFSGWPYATQVPRAVQPVPAAKILRDWATGHSDVTVSLHDAVRGVADYAHWQQT